MLQTKNKSIETIYLSKILSMGPLLEVVDMWKIRSEATTTKEKEIKQKINKKRRMK